MKTPLLNQKEIVVAPLVQDKTGEHYLVYAPFTGLFLEKSREEVLRLEQVARFTADKELQDTYARLTTRQRPLQQIQQIEETTEMSILLNYICNFSCSYCYSARGRSRKQIEKETLLTALDFFINRQRTRAPRLQLTFSGGGDPLASSSLLETAITYASRRAGEQGFDIRYGMVTNGTLLTPEIIGLVTSYKINLVISFDVLEEVHNKQRERYSDVCAGIDELISHQIYPGIRSTITPLNVDRMEEMVREMINRFPGLGGIAFEAVLNPSLFPTTEALKQFYTSFAENYFNACRVGLEHDFYVGNTLVNNAGQCRERACLSKFTLTPEGAITACSRISSPKEDFYDSFHYGTVTPDRQVQLDTDRLRHILSRNVYHYPECASCIARWHCSGGCLLARHVYSPEEFAIHCGFVREMLIQTLKNK